MRVLSHFCWFKWDSVTSINLICQLYTWLVDYVEDVLSLMFVLSSFCFLLSMKGFCFSEHEHSYLHFERFFLYYSSLLVSTFAVLFQCKLVGLLLHS